MIAHREFMKPLEDAEAVELNEENHYEDSESFLADMEGVGDEDNYSEDSYSSDSSDDEDAQNKLLWRMLQQKVKEKYGYGYS